MQLNGYNMQTVKIIRIFSIFIVTMGAILNWLLIQVCIPANTDDNYMYHNLTDKWTFIPKETAELSPLDHLFTLTFL